MTITSGFTKASQILALILQVLNSINVAGLPAKWQYGFTAGLGMLQMVGAILAHNHNPDGTPAPKA